MIGDERREFRIADGPRNGTTADRVGAVEHKHLLARLARRFEHQAERADVGVIACSDVLDVVNQGVQPFEIRGTRLPVLAIEADDRQARGLVLAVRHRRVNLAANSMLGAE